MARFGLAALTALVALAAPASSQDYSTVEPGYVKGTVRDMAGNPLAGAVVFMDGYDENNIQYTTQADGNYRLRLQPGAYRALGWLYRQWDGQNFKLDLAVDTTDTLNDADGAVRNFTWKLSGPKLPPDMGGYGAFVYAQIESGEYWVEDQENITFTLTPKELIDGSTGEVIVRQGGAPRTEAYGKILDIPIGRYVITGIYAPPGMKPQTLRFKDSWARNKGEWAESLEFGIKAEGNFCSLCASVEIEALKQPEPQ
jgi:hypothetical protein